MGISNGVDNRPTMRELFSFLATQFQVRVFIETGTYQGDTALFASGQFSRVVTLEGAPALFARAQSRLASCGNVECLCGDSGELLPGILQGVNEPAVFWLDAHWSGGETFGESSECPLLAELAAIYASSCTPYVIIDDARFFVSLPPWPHNLQSWPSYLEIGEFVRLRSPETLMTVYADAIVLAPQSAAPALIPYLRRPIPVPAPRRRWFRRAG